MRYWLLKILEVLDTINEGLNPSEPEENNTDSRSTKKNGGKKK